MKTWRIYFSSRDQAPHIWAVDNGTIDTQMLFKHNPIIAVRSYGGFNPNALKKKTDEPIVWIQCIAVLVIKDGTPYFYAEGDPDVK